MNDYSRYDYVYLIKWKFETFEKFKEFRVEVENQLGKRIKAIWSDWGGEYLHGDFKDYITQDGLVSQLTALGTPQQNSVLERRNRTLLEMVRSMMSYSTLPISFLAYALNTTIHPLNLVRSKSVPKTSMELWSGRKPSMRYLHIWGCLAHVLKGKLDELEPKSEVRLLLGYPKETSGYLFHSCDDNKVFVCKNAKFLEND